MQQATDLLKERFSTSPVLAFPEFYSPFIVETGASSDAVGAVLSQKRKEGKVNPIQFACRTMRVAN